MDSKAEAQPKTKKNEKSEQKPINPRIQKKRYNKNQIKNRAEAEAGKDAGSVAAKKHDRRKKAARSVILFSAICIVAVSYGSSKRFNRRPAAAGHPEQLSDKSGQEQLETYTDAVRTQESRSAQKSAGSMDRGEKQAEEPAEPMSQAKQTGMASSSATTVSQPLPRVALTFDDGPHPVYTKKLLDGLKRRGIRATFFVVGENISGNEELIRRMADEGHVIGNHTYGHVKRSSKRSPAAGQSSSALHLAAGKRRWNARWR